MIETLTHPTVLLGFVFIWSIMFSVQQLAFNKRLRKLGEELDQHRQFVSRFHMSFLELCGRRSK